jgi:hypothetical protein
MHREHQCPKSELPYSKTAEKSKKRRDPIKQDQIPVNKQKKCFLYIREFRAGISDCTQSLHHPNTIV